jgi:hypothetical protein
MTPAEELAAATEKLRKLSTTATPGPWRDHDTHLGQYGHTATVLSGEGNDTDLRAWLPSMSQEPWDERRNVWADAAYIAAMHPGVGCALADWLESTAELHEPNVCTKHEGCGPFGCQWCADEDWPCADIRNALAVARAVLGGPR